MLNVSIEESKIPPVYPFVHRNCGTFEKHTWLGNDVMLYTLVMALYVLKRKISQSLAVRERKKSALSPLAYQYYTLLGLEYIKMDLGIMIQSNEAKLMNECWIQEFYNGTHSNPN